MRCAKRYGAPTIRTVLRTRDKKPRSCSPMLIQPRELLRTMFDAAIGAASPKLRILAHLPQPPMTDLTCRDTKLLYQPRVFIRVRARQRAQCVGRTTSYFQ
jgi:hypothetical protein